MKLLWPEQNKWTPMRIIIFHSDYLHFTKLSTYEKTHLFNSSISDNNFL